MVLHLPIAIPCLKENRRISLRDKIWYSPYQLEVFDSFFVLDLKIVQVRFQICCYLWGSRARCRES